MLTFRRSLILAAILALTACATPPQAPVAAPPQSPAPAPGIDWSARANAFRQHMADSGVQVEVLPEGGGLRLTIPAASAFDSGKSQPAPALTQPLRRVADALAAHPALRAHIVGHTDSVGREGYNMLLSRQRARAVRNHLIALGGIEPARLSAEGKGEREPRVDNDSEDNRRLNRRIEIRVTLPR
ncbi:MAG: OmpA family protein [Rhodocyclaceae bacterium]|nr:OmpA family protein [Rhodocyclaceae bacterium]